MEPKDLLERIKSRRGEAAHETTFAKYLEMVQDDPSLARLSHALIADTIESEGIATGPEGEETAEPHAEVEAPETARPVEETAAPPTKVEGEETEIARAEAEETALGSTEVAGLEKPAPAAAPTVAMQLGPARPLRPFGARLGSVRYELTLRNNGDEPVELQLAAEDSEGECSFSLPDKASVPPNGARTINLKVRPRSRRWRGPRPGRIAARVSDTGVGIPAAEIPHIFERFYRVEKSRGEGPEGTGLGLAIARRILDLHGSSIAVESKSGAGTSFSFELPTAA